MRLKQKVSAPTIFGPGCRLADPRKGLTDIQFSSHLEVIRVLFVIFVNMFLKKRHRISDEQVSVMTGQLLIDTWGLPRRQTHSMNEIILLSEAQNLPETVEGKQNKTYFENLLCDYEERRVTERSGRRTSNPMVWASCLSHP